MNDMTNLPERLYEVRSRYVARFGPIHPVLSDLSPETLLVVLEMALEDRVEVDAASVERALAQVDDRVVYIRECTNR